MIATKSPRELREAFSTVDTAVACARLTDEERVKSNAALFAVRDTLERLARIEEATADLAEIRRQHEAMAERIANARKIASGDVKTADTERFTAIMDARRFVNLHESSDYMSLGTLLDFASHQASEINRLTSELATSRAVTDKTAIERDRFHDELIHEQAKVLRVAMAIENPDLADRIRQIVTEAEHIPTAIRCQRVADGVVGLLRMAINPRARS